MLRTEKMLGAGLLLVMFGFAAWGHYNLPDVPFAVHFNAGGEADGYQPRDIGLIVIPGISLVIMALMLWVLPPALPSIARSATVYGIVTTSLFTLMTATQAMLVLSAAGMIMDQVRIAFSGVGLLLVILGNYMPKMRRNWLMGIRTHWTLSDERVWDKTHRFSGPLFMLAGVVTLGAALFAPTAWRAPVLTGAVLLVCAVSYLYSYVAAKRLR